MAEARNGEEAVAATRKLKPAAVVMDLSMPGVDGWQATRSIKDDPTLAETFVVALTGHGEAHFRERATAAGVDDFILKPCVPEDLYKMLDERLRRR